MYINTHTYIYIYIYIYIHTYTHTHTHTYIYQAAQADSRGANRRLMHQGAKAIYTCTVKPHTLVP